MCWCWFWVIWLIRGLNGGQGQKTITRSKECPGKTIYFNFDSIFGDFFFEIFWRRGEWLYELTWYALSNVPELIILWFFNTRGRYHHTHIFDYVWLFKVQEVWISSNQNHWGGSVRYCGLLRVYSMLVFFDKLLVFWYSKIEKCSCHLVKICVFKNCQ